MTSVVHPIISPIANNILTTNPTDLSGGCVLSLSTPYIDIPTGKWYDASSGINHGSIVGASRPADMKGLHFDGVDDYINCGNNAVLNHTSDDFTLSAVVYPISLVNSPIIISKGDYNVSGYYFRISSNGSISFVTHQLGAHQTSYASAGTVVIDEWAFISVSRSGADATIYKNGVDVSGVCANHIDPASSSAYNLQLAQLNATTAHNLDGQIDQPRIINRAWSAKEELKYYNQIKRFYI